MKALPTFVALIFGLGLLLLPASVPAHQAPSGFDYDTSCCGGHDCRQIEDSKVALELSPIEGGWVVIPTAEIFHTADRARVKTSLDGHYHRCSAENGAFKGRTYCLYIPEEA